MNRDLNEGTRMSERPFCCRCKEDFRVGEDDDIQYS